MFIMERVIVGIDPGKKGAIAILSEDGSLLDMFDMPLTAAGKEGRVDARQLAGMLAGRCGTAVIEKVGYVPGDGGLGAFSFGESAGAGLVILDRGPKCPGAAHGHRTNNTPISTPKNTPIYTHFSKALGRGPWSRKAWSARAGMVMRPGHFGPWSTFTRP